MRKIAYFGTYGNSHYTYSGSMPNCDGMPRSAGTNLEAVMELYERTGNKGNMIHGEAPTRIFHADRGGSCYVSVEALDNESKWSAQQIADELSSRFDLVVYSTANAVRPNVNPGCTAEVLDRLRCEFVVLGMGMQNPLPPSTEGLHPNLLALLGVCNRKASVFGVRGDATEAWLKSVGFDRAKALGCPSFFVYPKNILSLVAPDPAKVKSAVTAGYIYGKVPRSSALVRLFDGFDAHYVMQEEVPILMQQGLLGDDPYLYNDATGELHKETIENVLEHVHRRKMPFSSYRWFQSPDAWRAFVSGFDFYLGDRLHGGVAALQTGVPALMMVEDQRVAEIADFFALPRFSINEVRQDSLREIVAERLNGQAVSMMKEAYLQRLVEFESTFKAMGLSLEPSISFAAASRGAGAYVQPSFPRPTVMRRAKDLVSELLRR